MAARDTRTRATRGQHADAHAFGEYDVIGDEQAGAWERGLWNYE